MHKRSEAPVPAIISIIALVWLSLGPVILGLLSFFHAMPTQWPALVYFAGTPLHWRVLFFIGGCLALLGAWLVHCRKYGLALPISVAFAGIYVPVFPIVWAQRTVGMLVAIVAVLLVGYLLVAHRRQEV